MYYNKDIKEAALKVQQLQEIGAEYFQNNNKIWHPGGFQENDLVLLRDSQRDKDIGLKLSYYQKGLYCIAKKY